MSLQAVVDNLVAQLLADADFGGWAQALAGRDWSAIRGNVPVVRIAPSELPALVIELGDGAGTPGMLGGQRQDLGQDLLLALVWHEQAPDAAFAQRQQLSEHLIRAVLREPTLGGAVAGAWVAGWQPDRGANHPKQILRATVRAELYIQRS